ncbi:MAG: bifunctional diaminohydroxyphosphoribosylaminopyrimidine deaminase/5-amino-6-(5-phosphoribosylamino)uracil reductase RibD [Chloroflexi bacterium]|nr:bifunctional diaminohydroxyphosphoribosylaminopyrimidine deaminase/5-amino-6-(5-phosphoribosylamino)uracil reductase RibD [Chloroflexota bacterium]
MEYMERALELASHAAGMVSPRPPVGCVLVKDGEIVGEGFTTPSPGPHAEVSALREAGDRARGSHAYTTLEPCNHHGNTPPCTDALLNAGVATVTAAIQDPDPRVDGNGIRRLKSAGIEVTNHASGEHTARAWDLIEGFARLTKTRRPLVIAKYAMSLDGKIATRTGDSQWITSEIARERVHRQRAQADAIMVGSGTVLADNPRLTARPGGEPTDIPRPRLRVLVDTTGQIPPSARMFWEPGAVLIVYATRSEDAGPLIGLPDNVEKLELPSGYGGVDLVMLIDEMGSRGIGTVIVEGGGRLIGSLIDLGLIDKIEAYIAPVIIGGVEAPGPVAGEGTEKLRDAPRLERVTTQSLGPDTLITGYVPGHTDHIPESNA